MLARNSLLARATAWAVARSSTSWVRASTIALNARPTSSHSSPVVIATRALPSPEASRGGGQRAERLDEQSVGDRMDAKPDRQEDHGHQGDLGREALADSGVDARQAELYRCAAGDVRSARRVVGASQGAR